MEALANVFPRGVGLLNEGRIDELMELYHPEFRLVMPNGQSLSKDEARDVYRMLRTAYPDGKFEIRRMIEKGETVVVEFTFRGTHTGPLMTHAAEIPPTGRPLSYRTCSVVDFRDGKIALWNDYFDQVAIFSQLGLI